MAKKAAKKKAPKPDVNQIAAAQILKRATE
jgi:hypothetical protein